MESSGIQVILPNMIEFIPMLLAFIIVALVLYKFGWPKFEEMLDKRKNKIEDSLKEAEEKNLESERLLQENKDKLAQAESSADEIIRDAKISSTEIGNKIEDKARQQAESIQNKANLAIEQQKRAAEQEIRTQAVDIAFSAIKKFISEDMTDDEHRKVIEKYVQEAGRLEA